MVNLKEFVKERISESKKKEYEQKEFIKSLRPRELKKLKLKQAKYKKALKKLYSGKLSHKQVFKPSKLKVEVSVPKEPLLAQRNKFFRNNYDEERRNILQW